MMIAGAGSPSVNSYDLQDQIAKTSRVCSYDRAGLGWSDAPTRPLGLAQIVNDLDALLTRSSEKGPYVLVPESFGGTIAVALVMRRPGDIARIIGVDPTEPSMVSCDRSGNDGRSLANRLWQIGWRVGLVRPRLNSQAPGWAANISPGHRGQFEAVWSRPMANFAHDWIDAYEQTPLRNVPVARPGLLGDKPLVVISHGVNTDYVGANFQRSWPGSQARWTRLSKSGVNIVAKDNSHMIAQENPALVAGAVWSVVKKLRSDRGS